MKVLSFGSLNLDYVYTVDHFVTAGETIASLARNEFCGGKGLNQSVALARAGAEVYHAGRIGPEGEVLRRRLRDSGVDVSLVEMTEEPTGHAVIQVDPTGQNCIIIHGGANRAITEADVDAMLEAFEAGDVLLMQNETSALDYAITKAAQKGLLVALNPSPMDETLKNSPALQHVHWFILNEIEGNALTGETEPGRICAALQERYPDCVVVLTLGKDGAMYDDGALICRHGIYDVPVVDTTAAGDTFAGYFIACVAKGLAPDEALRLASRASSLAVSRAGASDSIPTMEEVVNTEMKPL